MTREDILRSPEYWIAQIQIALYNKAEEFMQENNLTRTQLAERLGVSKGYVSQLLNGDYDHKLSKLVELALAFGVVPQIGFQRIEAIIHQDKMSYELPKWLFANYANNTTHLIHKEKYNPFLFSNNNNVA